MGGNRFHSKKGGLLQQEIQWVVVGGQLDILFLQEHHLSIGRTHGRGKVLPHTFWSPTFGPEGSQGGVCISVSDQLLPFVSDSGEAQWLIISFGRTISASSTFMPPTGK